MFFFDSKRGFLFGEKNAAYYTYTAGIEFVTQKSDTDVELNSTCFVDYMTGYAGGDKGRNGYRSS